LKGGSIPPPIANVPRGTLKTNNKMGTKKYKGYLTIAEQVKEFGAKVKRNGVGGYYVYHGKNFVVRFNQDWCETKWWEVAYWEENVDERVVEYFEGWNQYDTKSDLVGVLLNLDKSL
jgi:hypothetical protein